MPSSSYQYVVTNGKISFLLRLNNIPFIHHNFFIYSHIGGHSGCSNDLAIVNNAAVNMGVLMSFWVSLSFPLIKYPAVELLDQMVVLFLIFQAISILLSIWLHQLTFLSTVHRLPFSPHLYQHLMFFCHFDNSPFSRVKVISHCGFDLNFPHY